MMKVSLLPLLAAVAATTPRPRHIEMQIRSHKRRDLSDRILNRDLEIFEESEPSDLSCDDAVGRTRNGVFMCKAMDAIGFVSNAKLGSKSKTVWTQGCPDEQEPFDWISDIWGWTSPYTDKRYAIAGLYDGTSFVDVSDPTSPIVLGFMDHSGSLGEGNCRDAFWRDMKIYGDVVYIVSEIDDSGVQVYDLTQLDTLVRPDPGLERGNVSRIEPDNFINTIGRSHNVVEFTERGEILIVGPYPREDNNTNACDVVVGETVVVLDVASNPINPTISCIALGDVLNEDDREPYALTNSYPGYVHDGHCFVYSGPDSRYSGNDICVFLAETEIGIYNMDSGSMISTFSYENATYVHQGWVTEDFKTLYANDEQDEECQSGFLEQCEGLDQPGHPNTYAFDITDLEVPKFINVFKNTNAHPSIDHNLYAIGKRIYSANYEAGAWVYAIQESRELKDLAFFDISNECDDIVNCADPFGGTWTHFPFSSTLSMASNGYFGLHLFQIRDIEVLLREIIDLIDEHPIESSLHSEKQLCHARTAVSNSAMSHTEGAAGVLYGVAKAIDELGCLPGIDDIWSSDICDNLYKAQDFLQL